MARRGRVGTASSPKGPPKPTGLTRGEEEKARERLDDDGPTWLAHAAGAAAPWRRRTKLAAMAPPKPLIAAVWRPHPALGAAFSRSPKQDLLPSRYAPVSLLLSPCSFSLSSLFFRLLASVCITGVASTRRSFARS